MGLGDVYKRQIYSYADKPVVDEDGSIAAFCSSSGGWLPLICTMNCTVGTELMRNLFDTDIVAFEATLQASTRGAEGILTVPFFNGERTPNIPAAKACLFGLDSQHMHQATFLRATVEGGTFSLRAGLELLIEQGLKPKEIVLTGGGANSPTWRQTVADVCNMPVTILQNQESAAFGAALQALASESGEALEELTAKHIKTDVDACRKPQQTSVDFYTEHYQAYQKAAAHVEDLYR